MDGTIFTSNCPFSQSISFPCVPTQFIIPVGIHFVLQRVAAIKLGILASAGFQAPEAVKDLSKSS
jgi:hypothetical protein